MSARRRGGPSPTLELGLAAPGPRNGHPGKEPAGRFGAAPSSGPERLVRIYPFGVSRSRLEQAIRGVAAAVDIVPDVRDADAVITMRTYYRRKPPSIREAEERSLPIFVIKSNTAYQMEQVLVQLRGGATRQDPMAEVYRETEDAIARVIDEGKPVELAPANSYVRRLQHELASRYSLDSTSAGKEPFRRVKILPAGVGSAFAR